MNYERPQRSNCFSIVNEIVKEFGKINHLVNCVAYFGSRGLNATEEDWNKTMTVNVTSFSHMAQGNIHKPRGQNGPKMNRKMIEIWQKFAKIAIKPKMDHNLKILSTWFMNLP